jgi:hypothetical protein
MKKNLNLAFTDTFITAENFWTNILSKRYKITLDNADPDLLIFGDSNFLASKDI